MCVLCLFGATYLSHHFHGFFCSATGAELVVVSVGFSGGGNTRTPSLTWLSTGAGVVGWMLASFGGRGGAAPSVGAVAGSAVVGTAGGARCAGVEEPDADAESGVAGIGFAGIWGGCVDCGFWSCSAAWNAADAVAKNAADA